MKITYIIFLIMASCLFAQESKINGTDSSTVANVDSVDVAALVQLQIEAAKRKALEPIVYKPKVEEKIVVSKVMPKVQNASVNTTFTFFTKLPWHYQLFGGISVLILLFVLFRRAFLLASKKSLKKLKKNISLLREERVVSLKRDAKVDKARRELKNSSYIFNNSEKQLTKNAKQLNLSKGELLLAARLRLFEVGKL